jgi:predicted DNA-binding transcriptional regulator YafY
MRRADRLFQIVQRLRRRGVTTAAQLAEALEVSPRTIYRDVADLIASGVPFLGEAGVGYALPRGYDLPPLMFTEEEIEALVLGARAVRSWADPALARAADDALGKIENALPERLRHLVPESALFAVGFHVPARTRAGLGELRAAIRDRLKVRLHYADRAGAPSQRIVWPLGLFYWGTSWTLGLVRDARGLSQLPPGSGGLARAPGRTLPGRRWPHRRRPHASLRGGGVRAGEAPEWRRVNAWTAASGATSLGPGRSAC